MPAHERISLLRRAAEIVEARGHAFAELIAREGVKTIREARTEVARCVETLRLSAEEARRIAGQTIPFDQRPGSERRVGYWVRQPVGVVAAITPFNDPLNLVAHKVGPAVAAGNAIVVKPHSATPLSALRLADALHEAGLPPSIVQVLPGRGSEIGEALVGDPRVALVTFTGGPEVGDRIVLAAGRKRLVLELGANSPVIVLADADLEAAAAAIVAGAFAAAGQNCLHVQRVIVERPVAEQLRSLLVERAASVRYGDKRSEETDMGPLIDLAAAERVAGVVADAVRRGGRLLVGGRRHGTFFEPTLVDGLPPGSRLARDEVFGPVTGIVAVDSIDEAISIANGVQQALQAAVFTNDLRTALRIVDELDFGGVIVNDSTDYRIDAMPFGGVKGSGLGREGVPFAVQEMTTTKVVALTL
jgi:glyceraldehyde-3-phosphate dehydrogenase (NADP+)